MLDTDLHSILQPPYYWLCWSCDMEYCLLIGCSTPVIRNSTLSLVGIVISHVIWKTVLSLAVSVM